MPSFLRQKISDYFNSDQAATFALDDVVRDLHDSFPGVSEEEVRAALKAKLGELSSAMGARLVEVFGPDLDQLEESTERIAALIHTSTTLPPRTAADVLRAAAVLLHAYLENFLRSLAAAFLPSGDGQSLNDIPLAETGGRREKFNLGELARHRGKTVDTVLRESVLEHLERSNYNSTDDIASLLIKLGLKSPDLDVALSTIAELIDRRHLIVHRQDRVQPAGSDQYVLQPIEPPDVARWGAAVTEFAGRVITIAFTNKHLAETINAALGKSASPTPSGT